MKRKPYREKMWAVVDLNGKEYTQIFTYKNEAYKFAKYAEFVVMRVEIREIRK